MNKYALSFIMMLSALWHFDLEAQNKKFIDSTYIKRSENAKNNVEGLTALLGLSNDQASKLRYVEVAFVERLNGLRDPSIPGRARSNALKELYQQHDKDIAGILTKGQMALLDARNKQIQQKIEQSARNRPKKPVPSAPVKLPRKN
ncbi:hypothetical protein [Niabella hibiscisoli]|uniref:hypothetical protein n=1 Tax=Niabella hibiscisoli TaxID=1825928 RepID=UPI001F11188E|nr:hypothetical protein [Niabella hibiscisoli]MCH5718200.1 hypothetical protein [Niabella hibiscisoli]